MAMLKDIVRIEQDERAAMQSWSTIYLFNENEFWRAYEWSAWLFCRYIKEYTVKRREHKGYGLPDDTTAMLGFPPKSEQTLQLPDGTQTVKSSDGMRMEYILPFSIFQENFSVDGLTTDFLNWKKSFPIGDYKKSEGNSKSGDASEAKLMEVLKDGTHGVSEMHRMSDIVLRIMSFPIEQKSPIDCMNFLIEMKKQIIAFY